MSFKITTILALYQFLVKSVFVVNGTKRNRLKEKISSNKHKYKWYKYLANPWPINCWIHCWVSANSLSSSSEKFSTKYDKTNVEQQANAKQIQKTGVIWLLGCETKFDHNLKCQQHGHVGKHHIPSGCSCGDNVWWKINKSRNTYSPYPRRAGNNKHTRPKYILFLLHI